MRSLILFASLLLAARTEAQLVLNGAITPEQIVQNTLLGPGVTISNVTFNGLSGNVPHEQVGWFNGTDCALGIDSGLVMCTGGIEVAIGPNDWSSAFVELFNDDVWDEDLNNVAGDWCMDNAVLEFDFVPQGDSISFAYSFASEEYLEYVNAGYNDAFGFFLSGPGIFGPFENDAVNLAVVPGTFSYVSVNTVHPGSNAQYYQDNGNGSNAPYSTNPFYFQFDGFTIGLMAGAAVQCGQTYHIKMAIGDVGDPNWDSGVFIAGGSFSSTGGIQVSIETSSGGEAAQEGCEDAVVTITRPSSTGELIVPITASGTAGPSTDVDGIPPAVTIPDGAVSVSFPITFPTDGVVEGDEELVLCATIAGACGGADTACASVLILDTPPIVADATDVISECTGAQLTLTASATGGAGELSFSWSTGSDQVSITVPDGPGAYEVTVSDACGDSAIATAVVSAPCAIVIPNVFSPNNDGSNDFFQITGIETLNNHVSIYNRWGQVVFEASNYANNWSGEEVSDGTYYYEVRVDGHPDPFTGHLTILANQN